jgi:HlyD family secretion protein
MMVVNLALLLGGWATHARRFVTPRRGLGYGPGIAALLIGVLLLPGCSGSRTSSYQGYVEGEFVYLASSQPGHLEHLAVSRGQRVESGTQLFALEAIEEAAKQQQAQRQLAAAEAQLADIETGKRPPEMAVIVAQLAQTQASAHKSALQRERDETQYRTGGISREQLEATLAQATSDAARQQVGGHLHDARRWRHSDIGPVEIDGTT